MLERYSGQVIWEMLAAVKEQPLDSEPQPTLAFAELVRHMYPSAQQALLQWRDRQCGDAAQEDLVAACIAHTQCISSNTWSDWLHWLLWQGQRRFRASVNDPESMSAWMGEHPADDALRQGRALAAAFAGCHPTPIHLPALWWPASLDEALPWCKDRVPSICRALGWEVQIVEGHAISDSAPPFR